MKALKLYLILIILIFTTNVSALENCKWDNRKGVPCIVISKTPNTSSFSEGVLLAVNLGNDADTTGAIFGQLAGAYYGYSEIPDHWKSQLVNRALIEYLALKLFEGRP